MAISIGEGIPFAIDSQTYDQADVAAGGTYLNDGQFVTVCEGTEPYNVVVQPIPGYKPITQVIEPITLRYVHVVIYTFTQDQRDFLDGLSNEAPHTITACDLFPGPILMYLQTKARRKWRTGIQPFGMEWDIKWIEANDNPA